MQRISLPILPKRSSTGLPPRAKSVPAILADKLVDRYYNVVPTIRRRLSIMNEYRKRDNVGTLPSQTPHANAVKYATDNGHQLAVGYLVTPDRQAGGVKMEEHTWCVDIKTRAVIEPTEGIAWNNSVRYFGISVPEHLWANHRYLDNFNRADAFTDELNPLFGE